MAPKKSLMLLSILTGLTSLVSFANAADEYYWGNVRFDGGGFVSAVIPSSAEKDLIYARTDVGGAYRWDAVNSRWIPLTDWVSQNDVGLLGIEALALDPNDKNRIYMLAGTSYFSDGKTAIMRSANKGATWDTTIVSPSLKAHGNGMGRQSGEKLVVDPQNGQVLYCGSRMGGLFKSTDGAVTWNQISTLGQGGSLVNDIGISFVLVDPNGGLTGGASKRVIMGVANSSGNLYISEDAGATFDLIQGGPTQLPMRAILIGQTLYITFSSNSGPHSVSGGSVYKYSLASGIWTNITPKDGEAYYGSGGQAYAHGFGGISKHPTDTNTLVLSTMNHYGGNQGTDVTNWTGPWGDQIFYSKDQGQTWEKVFNGSSSLSGNGTQWIAGHSIHWPGSITFDPFDPSKVWVVSGNGVFRTDDITQSARVFKFQSKGIEETVPLDVVSVEGGPLVTAIGDYDGMVYDNITASNKLHSPEMGTTYSLGYAPLTGEFIRAGQVTIYGANGSVNELRMYHSTDTARTWTQVGTPQGLHGMLAMNADGSAWFHKPENSVSFYRSADQGKNWTLVSGLTSQSQYAPLVADPVNPDRLYLLDNMGDFYASSDAGANFVKVGSVVDNSLGYYSSSNMKITTVPGNEGEIWVPLDQSQAWVQGGYSQNGLAYTNDGGQTFTRLANVNICISISLGKAAEGAAYDALYMWGAANGGPIGIYRSIDKGKNWERINDDAHQFGGPGNASRVIADRNIFGRVYMTTAGRGLVYGNVGGPASGDISPVVTAPKSVASMQVIEDKLYIDANGFESLQLDIVNAKGEIVLSQSLKNSQSEISLALLKSDQVYWARLQSKGQLIGSLRIY